MALLLLCNVMPAYAETTNCMPCAVIMGNLDDDTRITATDARLVLQYTVGKTELSEIPQALADVDGSGKVDATDDRLILQYAVGKKNPKYNIGHQISWEQKNGKWYIVIHRKTIYAG